jgi:signal transduction histidine kinase
MMIGEVVRRQLAPHEDIAFHFCSDPNKAIATALAEEPTVILQDLVMPGVDGLSLVRRYRETDGVRNVPVIVLSTKEDPKVKAEAFALGANDYIVKVPDGVELVARIRHHSKGYIAELERNEAFENLRATLEELRETQAQLVMREKMASLGNLVAGVAHEMNTPLGALNSNNDVLLRTVEKLKQMVEDAPENVESTQRTRVLKLLANAVALGQVNKTAAGRMDKIITGLRSFARLDRAEEDRFDVREGLDSTLVMIESLLGDRIKVVRDFSEVPAIRCYPGQINQVFLNILTNAAEAIEGDGEITLRCSADADNVAVEVRDTGCGIPVENLSKIFDPGFTSKGVKVGTGLGLSTAQRIVDDHQGKLTVTSVPGAGTTVLISLPLGWG